MTARDRKVLIIVVALAAVAASWMLAIQPQRNQAGQLQTQITSAQSQLSSARSVLAAGQSARLGFARSYAMLARLGEAVPTDDNVPSLIYQVQSAASAATVDFQSLALAPGTGSSTPASSSSASPAETASLPPGATVGPAGFPIEPFSFTFQGNFFHLSDFLGRLEHLVNVTDRGVAVSGRLMTLNAVSLAAAPTGFPQITATVSATTYLLPAAQGLTNGATPTGPTTPAASPVVSHSSGSVPSAPAAIASPVK